MILPSTLSDPIEMARNSIRQVNPLIDSSHHLRNAERSLLGIANWVEMTATIQAAVDRALEAITPLYRLHNSVVLDPSRLDAPKAEFNARVDSLAAALLISKPSDEANALGLGW